MPRRRARGFTLTELMVTVAIVGALAVLAVYGVRKYVFASKSTEAIQMIGSIKTAQEAFKDETGVYHTASTSIDTYYPMTTPGTDKYHWQQTGHADFSKWRALGVTSPNPVQFGYATVAGNPGDSIPALGTVQVFNFPATGEPWYVIKAVGDRNADAASGGKKAILVGSSFVQEIYAENEHE